MIKSRNVVLENFPILPENTRLMFEEIPLNLLAIGSSHSTFLWGPSMSNRAIVDIVTRRDFRIGGTGLDCVAEFLEIETSTIIFH
jgi:hypothetical protein